MTVQPPKEAERDRFEAWARQGPANLERLESGPYVSSTVSFAWRAWQARAALPAEPARVLTLQWMDGPDYRERTCYDDTTGKILGRIDEQMKTRHWVANLRDGMSFVGEYLTEAQAKAAVEAAIEAATQGAKA